MRLACLFSGIFQHHSHIENIYLVFFEVIKLKVIIGSNFCYLFINEKNRIAFEQPKTPTKKRIRLAQDSM